MPLIIQLYLLYIGYVFLIVDKFFDSCFSSIGKSLFRIISPDTIMGFVNVACPEQ